MPLPTLAQATHIRILHGSAPGAPQDIMLRIPVEEMACSLSHTVLVEARPGAKGQIVMNLLDQAPVDGNVILSDDIGIVSILLLTFPP